MQPDLPDCIGECGRVDAAVLGGYIQQCQDQPLRELLQRLNRVLVQVEKRLPACAPEGHELQELQVQVRCPGRRRCRPPPACAGSAACSWRPGQARSSRSCDADPAALWAPLPLPSAPPQELMGGNSAGVACILAASQPRRYLAAAEEQREQLQRLQQKFGQDARALRWAVLDLFLPSRELELDMRGTLEVEPGLFANIDVGECKSSADYANAVPQLGQRLAALSWLVRTCFEVPAPQVQLVGRMFVAARRDGAAAGDGADEAQQRLAKDEWGYRLVVHWVR